MNNFITSLVNSTGFTIFQFGTKVDFNKDEIITINSLNESSDIINTVKYMVGFSNSIITEHHNGQRTIEKQYILKDVTII